MKSPLNYFGGKSTLAPKIVDLIPEHTCYCEPFSGAAWVFFTKEPSKVEVLNDADGDLINFWRVVQNHLQPFLDYYKFAIISRKMFEIEKLKDPRTLTDLQRAARYYYLQKNTFAGKTKGRTFSAAPTKPSGLNLSMMEEQLLNTHWRLQRVTIENLHAVDCITRYDRPETFFYIDPPYYFHQDSYIVKFSTDEFIRMRDTLKGIKGRFILSINDSPETRDLFADFKIRTVNLRYRSGNARKAPDLTRLRSELLISNE